MSSKTYFDQVAAEWDSMRAAFFSEAVREKAFTVAGVRAGQLAADIGAGTGFMAEGLRQRGLDVIAVDQSETMLHELAKRLDGVECRTGSADALPIPAATVDHAFANMYLHHVETPANAIREIARVVKPGGWVVITDLDEHQFEFLRTEHHDRWMGFERGQMHAWLVDAGLKNVLVDCAGADCCAESSNKSERAAVSIFVAGGQK